MATVRIDDYTKQIITDETKLIQVTVGGQTYDFGSARSLVEWIKANLQTGGLFENENFDITITEGQ